MNKKTSPKKQQKYKQVLGNCQKTAITSSLSMQSQIALFESNQQQLVFSFQIEQDKIFQLFEELAEQLYAILYIRQFTIIEKQSNHETVIKNKQAKMLDIFNCMSWFQSTTLTAIKLTISENERNDKKVCRVKGLVGQPHQLVNFIIRFTQMTRMFDTNQIQFVEESKYQVKQQPSNPFYLQACAMYTFRQILSTQTNQICQILNKQINDFAQSFKNAQESIDLLPLAMKNILTLSNETISKLQATYKDDKNIIHLMPFCRISVERYLFDKTQMHIHPIYEIKNRQTTLIYLEKKNRIFKELNVHQILNEVSLNKNFWFCKEDDLQKKVASQQMCILMGFNLAEQELEKIKLSSNPRQKIKFIEHMYGRLKSLIYEKTNKKHQLFNMEDIIPVMILMLLFCKIKEIRTQIDIMSDFIQNSVTEMQSQKRLILHLSESFHYIVRDWKI